MAEDGNVKQKVREFYDQVGWQVVVEGAGQERQYQNARYEDLRPVSRDYIRGCHLRIARHLKPTGRYLLDAGSGPIQYPEYLAYSQGYSYRVCADISIIALQQARNRIAGHGLFVVADVANLPFKPGAFDGVVSLHTIHHLPEGEHMRAYQELRRVLAPASQAVIVNGWDTPPLTRILEAPLRLRKRLRNGLRSLRGKPALGKEADDDDRAPAPKGTFVQKKNAAWLKRELGGQLAPGERLEIRVWRSVSVRFLRFFIRPRLGGRFWLRLLYRLEERFPRFFGENGQYPLIIVSKS